MGGQLHALADLPPGMIWYPLYRRLDGPQGLSEQAQKITPPLGFNPRTIQPVASSCFAFITLSKLLHNITGNMIEELFF